MKYIDPKSLTIGVLAASLVFACTDSNNKTANSPSLVSEAKAATGVGNRWDDKVEWWYANSVQLQKTGHVKRVPNQGPLFIQGEQRDFWKVTGGWEPIGSESGHYHFRKRIK